MQRRILKLVDLDELFAQSAETAVILNRIDYNTIGYSEQLNSKVYSRAGELNFVASCDCGHYEGNFFIGVKCPKCNTLVRDDFSPTNRLQHTAWIGMPEHIPGVLHPTIYLILAKWLRYSRKTTNYMDAIIDPHMELPPDLEGVIHGRGHRYFYDNFDVLMDYFLNHHKKTSKKQQVPYIKHLLAEYRSICFCKHLPVLSSVLHPITSEGGINARRYVDESSKDVLEAAIDLSTLEFGPSRGRTVASYESIVFNAYKTYIKYIETIFDTRLGRKESLLRHHLFGTRFHFSFRSVIVPITGRHSYEELHLPWCIGVNLLKIHIIGRLMQRHGYDIGTALAIQSKAITVYDPLIDQIIKELITESPFSTHYGNKPGLPILLNRNPVGN